LKELLKGVGDMKNWLFKESGGNITAAWPEVPGHVDGSDWKMYVERGRQTVDRLQLTGRKYVTVPNKSKPDTDERRSFLQRVRRNRHALNSPAAVHDRKLKTEIPEEAPWHSTK
jgi:hypothetical protein